MTKEGRLLPSSAGAENRATFRGIPLCHIAARGRFSVNRSGLASDPTIGCRDRPSSTGAIGPGTNCLSRTGASRSPIFVRHLPKSAKHMLFVEPPDLEIGTAAVGYRTGVAKYLPKSFRTLDSGGRGRAMNGFTRCNATINEIERQCHERSDFNHCSHLAAHPGAIRISSYFSRARDMDGKVHGASNYDEDAPKRKPIGEKSSPFCGRSIRLQRLLP